MFLVCHTSLKHKHGYTLALTLHMPHAHAVTMYVTHARTHTDHTAYAVWHRCVMHMSHQHMHACKITSHSIYNADMHMHESYLVLHLVLRVIALFKFSEEGGQLTHTSLFHTNKLDRKKARKR